MLSLVNMGGQANHLLRAESPGPTVSKMVPNMRKSAAILYGIYIVMTAVEVVLLLLGGMPLFDSLCTAFGTAGTGGFGIKNSSMGYYDSYYLQGVVSVFIGAVRRELQRLLFPADEKICHGMAEYRGAGVFCHHRREHADYYP